MGELNKRLNLGMPLDADAAGNYLINPMPKYPVQLPTYCRFVLPNTRVVTVAGVSSSDHSRDNPHVGNSANTATICIN